MKKIFALALAIVMMMAIALPVFAEESTEATKLSTVYGEDNDSQIVDDEFELEYGVAQTYTVIIPEEISFNAGLKDQKRTLSVENAILAGNERIEISIDSLNDWQLLDYETDNVAGTTVSGISDAVDYWFDTKSGTVINFDATQFGTTYDRYDDVLVVDRAAGNKGIEGAKGSVDLYFSTRGTAQEGTYRDYLTFVVEIGTYVAPQQGN